MIHLPGMLLLGSTGRNAGKTTFGCALIRHLAEKQPLLGIKVTVIRDRETSCPRGDEGCGVCESMKNEYILTEETLRRGEKDTEQLLLAGAINVFWLRVMERSLEEGVKVLLDRIGTDPLCVCESNSLRKAVKPGLFLMMKGAGAKSVKHTARAVIHEADRVVEFDRGRYDLSLDEIGIDNGRWRLLTSPRDEASALKRMHVEPFPG